ncbi:adenosylmethionine--8-amino-7-oxononanoate transaminase [Aestuariicella hydrocarbonica]|uniref:Adenosylmethionine-8-amino-7-oxononanoate aminotransferase n=1 Tax=Pseudomaricurvus hydrocarbonicus TaxID=1470433 RepID=A0A9E5T1S1_9GAMM|nr:adenosylmethionine--8-amino-7-oxononanoate transaminase [Aestuariicella hydrocarbonica]NHO67066.1 adenosylmethionine--8-amino-7-oxononanoate transaminase [Aestuariicella hydrocarbonica]
MTIPENQIISIDQAHVWHPYASFIEAPPVFVVASAQGSTLTLSDGSQLLDGMSSWWCTIHGYNHDTLNQAAKDQLDKMSHVMFGGLTHAPAAELAQLLVDITPASLNKVFFSDSGSVAVEVAMKMAIQFWHSQGQPQKSKLLSLRNGYHGDTFGAMSVCDPVTGMHHLFNDNLMQNLFADAPVSGYQTKWDDAYIANFQSLIEEHHQQLAAVILEPIVQGAGGMRIYPPEYLRQVRRLCDKHDVLLIADEIATGFGRTGKLFACEHAQIEPDILCLGKALTGGYMTMAATLCNDRISDGICRGEAGVFMHGPTFMGNPLAAATALASTRLLLNQDWQSNIQRIESLLSEGLAPCRQYAHVEDVRIIGAIGVVEMTSPVIMTEIQKAFMAEGVWIRPFGKLVYVMPPYVMTDEELTTLTSAMTTVLARPELLQG